MSEATKAIRFCARCDGEGRLPANEPAPDDSSYPGLDYLGEYGSAYGGASEMRECTECTDRYSGDYEGHADRYGHVQCPDCDGTGDSADLDVDGDPLECEACDGRGHVQCPACDGDGTESESCGVCRTAIDPGDDIYHGEGEYLCGICAADAFTCPDCKGTGRAEVQPVDFPGNGDPLNRSYAPLGPCWDCSCCGARGYNAGTVNPRPGLHYDRREAATDPGWYTFKAGIRDSDGVYYAHLCGDADGLRGCLETWAEDPDTWNRPADSGDTVLENAYLYAGDRDAMESDLSDRIGSGKVNR